MQEKRLAPSFIQRQEENEEEEPEQVQTKQVSTVPAQRQGLSTRLQSLQGGEPLPASTRAFFEPRFGADFGHVRVHTSSEAAETAQAINAQAFTRGRDIVFGAGRYQPQTSDGQRLLAHELTHVIQQNQSGIRARFNAAGNATVSRLPSEPADFTVQRRCVNTFSPQLRCCHPTLPARQIGTRAHRQLEEFAALLDPGTIGEVALPPVLFDPRWRFADLYATNPRVPVKIPSRRGVGRVGRFHPMVNPHRLPTRVVPPAMPASSALIGEIKPFNALGVSQGVTDLGRNILKYDAWHFTRTGIPGSYAMPTTSVPALIPGGFLFSPLQFLFAFRTIPGLYTYCCLDIRRIARRLARFLRRLWERAKELFRRLKELLERYWKWILVAILVIVAIILIIVFWEAIVAAAAAVIAAIGTFLAWLLGTAPVWAPALLILIMLLNSSSAEATSGSEGSGESAGEGEEIEEAPGPASGPGGEVSGLPFGIPPEAEQAGESVVASLNPLDEMLDQMAGFVRSPTSVPITEEQGRTIARQAPDMLRGLLPILGGNEQASEVHDMVESLISHIESLPVRGTEE